MASFFLYLADPVRNETLEEEERKGETLHITCIIFVCDPTPPSFFSFLLTRFRIYSEYNVTAGYKDNCGHTGVRAMTYPVPTHPELEQ